MPAWNDLRVSLESTRINPATSKPDLINFIGNTKVYGFDPSSVEGVTFSLQMPHNYIIGSRLRPHIHFSPTTTNVGDIVFGLECTMSDVNGTFPSTTTVYATATTSGIVGKHQILSFPEISGFQGTSGMICCYLFRNATDSGDTYTGDVAVLEYDIHYQVGSFGSRQEFIM